MPVIDIGARTYGSGRMARAPAQTRGLAATRQAAVEAAAIRQLRQQAYVEDIDYRTPRGLDPRPADDAGRRQLDRRPRQPADQRTLRRRQELARLGARNKVCRDNRSCSISAFRGCSPISLWRAATAATPASCARSAALIFLSSTIGASSRSTPPRARPPGDPRRPLRPPLCVTSQFTVDQLHALIDDPPTPTPSSTAWSITPTHRSPRREPAANPQIRPKGLSPWRCGHAAALGQCE
jgi:hypothetical protein